MPSLVGKAADSCHIAAQLGLPVIPVSSLVVGLDLVLPIWSICNRTSHLYSDVSMHVTYTFASCFAVVRQICSIHRSVRFVRQSLIVKLIMSRLDYGGAMLAGLPARLLNIIQSVLNAATRLISELRKYDHMTTIP